MYDIGRSTYPLVIARHEAMVPILNGLWRGNLGLKGRGEKLRCWITPSPECIDPMHRSTERMVSETPCRATKQHFDGTGTEIQMCRATKALPVGTGMGKSTCRATKAPSSGTGPSKKSSRTTKHPSCNSAWRRCEKMLGTCAAIK